MRNTTVWSPGLVPTASVLVAATQLHLEQGTEVLAVPIRSPLYASAVDAHLATLGAKFAHTFSAVEGFPDTQSAHALMRNCLGPANVQYALRTLPLRHTVAFEEEITRTQRTTWNSAVGTPVSAAAWVQITLPISEGGCGVSSSPGSADSGSPAVHFPRGANARLRPATGRTTGHQGGAAGCPQRPPAPDARAPCELGAHG